MSALPGSQTVGICFQPHDLRRLLGLLLDHTGKASTAGDFPCRTMQNVLQKASNVKTLKISCVPGILEPVSALSILNRTLLPNLTYFDSTVSHLSMLRFISRHRIAVLTVGNCDLPSEVWECPFSGMTRHGNHCGSIVSLSGPMSCVTHLIDGNPITVLDLSWCGAEYIPLFLETVRYCSESICELELEFSGEYPRLLHGVGELLPELYSLRLREKREVPLEYPWEDKRAWRSELSSFRELRIFEIRARSGLTLANTDADYQLLWEQWFLGCNRLEDFTIAYGDTERRWKKVTEYREVSIVINFFFHSIEEWRLRLSLDVAYLRIQGYCLSDELGLGAPARPCVQLQTKQ
ncbi:hypothetical protein IW261DRAFT_1426350 [Armillaria novae-zelandiae]|uniref:Uncharacterized protein n=1 Tax=Armillaria novae-zelandiae TaxID=153914 RepID=A0AA39TS43_9AGAR|nr:hypothetical protein IW261DRAFT_1426350 [Armillaria novae-zelandiae]